MINFREVFVPQPTQTQRKHYNPVHTYMYNVVCICKTELHVSAVVGFHFGFFFWRGGGGGEGT